MNHLEATAHVDWLDTAWNSRKPLTAIDRELMIEACEHAKLSDQQLKDGRKKLKGSRDSRPKYAAFLKWLKQVEARAAELNREQEAQLVDEPTTHEPFKILAALKEFVAGPCLPEHVREMNETIAIIERRKAKEQADG